MILRMTSEMRDGEKWLPTDEHTNQVLAKTKEIFSTIIDQAAGSVTVSCVITHLAKYEPDWHKFPRDVAGMSAFAAEKIFRYLHNVPQFSAFYTAISKFRVSASARFSFFK